MGKATLKRRMGWVCENSTGGPGPEAIRLAQLSALLKKNIHINMIIVIYCNSATGAKP